MMFWCLEREQRTIESAEKDHDQNVKALMERCRVKNLKLNKDKVKLKLTQLPFIGHVVTSQGLKPDPEYNVYACYAYIYSIAGSVVYGNGVHQ